MVVRGPLLSMSLSGEVFAAVASLLGLFGRRRVLADARRLSRVAISSCSFDCCSLSPI